MKISTYSVCVTILLAIMTFLCFFQMRLIESQKEAIDALISQSKTPIEDYRLSRQIIRGLNDEQQDTKENGDSSR